MTLTPFGQDVVVAAFVALLAGLGWLITSQISTNKSLSKGLTDAVTEFKVAMTMIEERNTNQKMFCQLYRSKIEEYHKDLGERLMKIEDKIESMESQHHSNR